MTSLRRYLGSRGLQSKMTISRDAYWRSEYNFVDLSPFSVGSRNQTQVMFYTASVFLPGSSQDPLSLLESCYVAQAGLQLALNSLSPVLISQVCIAMPALMIFWKVTQSVDLYYKTFSFIIRGNISIWKGFPNSCSIPMVHPSSV